MKTDTERLSALYKNHCSFVTPAPDSSGGGSKFLHEQFLEIVLWDTFVAGMASSYLKAGREQEHVHIIRKAAVELPTIISLLDSFRPKTEREDRYRTTYKNWTISLLNLITALKECYRMDGEFPQV